MTNFPNFEFDFIGDDSEAVKPKEEPAKMQKRRFVSLTSKSLDELLDGEQSKPTKYSTKFAVNLYKG